MVLQRMKLAMLGMILGIVVLATNPVFANVGGDEVEKVLSESDFVSNDDGIMTMELATASVNTRISKTDTGVKAICTFAGTASLKSVTVKLSIQKYSSGSWNIIKTWSGSTEKKSYVLTKSKAVESGKYRAKCVFTTKTSSKSDSFTKYSSIVNK